MVRNMGQRQKESCTDTTSVECFGRPMFGGYWLFKGVKITHWWTSKAVVVKQNS